MYAAFTNQMLTITVESERAKLSQHPENARKKWGSRVKFRKKPVVIEAFCVGLHKEPEWFLSRKDWVAQNHDHHTSYQIRTLEGDMTANFGDWIIKGVNDEIYPCKSDIFEKTYEDAE